MKLEKYKELFQSISVICNNIICLFCCKVPICTQIAKDIYEPDFLKIILDPYAWKSMEIQSLAHFSAFRKTQNEAMLASISGERSDRLIVKRRATFCCFT